MGFRALGVGTGEGGRGEKRVPGLRLWGLGGFG